MDMKEFLIERIQKAVGGCSRYWAELIADALIDGGVTVGSREDLRGIDYEQV